MLSVSAKVIIHTNVLELCFDVFMGSTIIKTLIYTPINLQQEEAFDFVSLVLSYSFWFAVYILLLLYNTYYYRRGEVSGWVVVGVVFIIVMRCNSLVIPGNMSMANRCTRATTAAGESKAGRTSISTRGKPLRES